jgi:hypothetical protein
LAVRLVQTIITVASLVRITDTISVTHGGALTTRGRATITTVASLIRLTHFVVVANSMGDTEEDIINGGSVLAVGIDEVVTTKVTQALDVLLFTGAPGLIRLPQVFPYAANTETNAVGMSKAGITVVVRVIDALRAGRASQASDPAALVIRAWYGTADTGVFMTSIVRFGAIISCGTTLVTRLAFARRAVIRVHHKPKFAFHGTRDRAARTVTGITSLRVLNKAVRATIVGAPRGRFAGGTLNHNVSRVLVVRPLHWVGSIAGGTAVRVTIAAVLAGGPNKDGVLDVASEVGERRLLKLDFSLSKRLDNG